MFEDCRRPRPLCIRGVVKALLIAIVTVAITVPCIRLGQAIVRTSKDSSTVSPTVDHEPEVAEVQGERLAMSTVALPVLYQKPESMDVPDNRTAAEKQSQGHDMKLFGRQVASRSWNADTVRDGHSVGDLKFPISRRTTPPKSVVGGKFIRQMPYSDTYEKTRDVAEVNNYIKSDLVSNTETYKTNSRPNHRQLNEYDDSTLQIDAQKNEKNSFTSNKGPHDYLYMGNRGSKESENSRDESGWTTMHGPEQILSGSTTSGNSDSFSQPSSGLGLHYTASDNYENRYDTSPNRQAGETINEYFSPTYGTYYGTQPIPEPDGLSPIVIPNRPLSTTSRPMVIPQSAITSTVQPSILSNQPVMMSNINWRRIGFILTLVKLWMVKMKAIGFLKALFLLLFKLKFFLVALFFKFILLLKLLLIFKFQVIPLLFLPLLPIMVSLAYPLFTVGLLSIPGQIINTILGRVNMAVTPASASVSDSSSPSSAVVNSIPGSATITQQPVQVLKTIPDSIIDPFRLFKGRSFDFAKSFDPTLQYFFQKLNSENCVRRMACEMAFAGKTGKIPIWTNEVLRGVSKLFSSEKLENYFKTYDYVINEMCIKSLTLKKWTIWCLENYGCNNTNVTNITDTIQ